MNDETSVDPNIPTEEPMPPGGYPPVEPGNIHPGVRKPQRLKETTTEESDLVNGLQDEVDRLELQIGEMAKAITEPENRRAGLNPAIVAMALTVRNCQRRGHPDASKHIETLLTMLGV